MRAHMDSRETPPAAFPWHSLPATELSARLEVDPEKGLSATTAAERLAQLGGNEVFSGGMEESWWDEVLESLTEPLVLLLIAVGVLYAVLGELADAVTIFLVILAVAAIEVVNESRAKRAIASLRTLAAAEAMVVRSGRTLHIPAAELVPGDLVLLQAGVRVPADLRLLESAALRIDESNLTGESAPAPKEAELVLPEVTELGDRRNLAFGGTVVTSGKGRGIVVATGPATEVGRIAKLTEEVREGRTPLQRHLKELAGWLAWAALAFSVLVPVLGILVAHRPWREMLLTGLTLAFATIPEELPILITVVLGIGAYRLAREKAIVKRLRAAETLGSVSAVATDKTGTLTENRMAVARITAEFDPVAPDAGGDSGGLRRLLHAVVLANDAQVRHDDGQLAFSGDPTEKALLAYAEKASLGVSDVRASVRIIEEFPFDDARKRMSVVYQAKGERRVALKGAPEAVLDVCTTVLSADGEQPLTEERTRGLAARAARMAAEGLRVLAAADRRITRGIPLEENAVEAELTFLGLIGLADPPRPEAHGAIQVLRGAGIRVLMVTGDHPATARAIAEQVGIEADRVVLGREVEGAGEDDLRRLVENASVFARIAPEHKLRVVRALQGTGEVTAVTGDGVNDAPALREAAIGVAMGETGTDIAREAADIVLADDNLATLTVAVGAGRTLYANLRKAVRYYLAAKVALITASLIAVLLRLPIPFSPLQIILLELFMDVGASTTFVAEAPEGAVMARPPRAPARPFMDRSMQLGILTGGLLLAAAVLIPYLSAWSYGPDLRQAQTAAFAAWMVGHLVLAANMRSERQSIFSRALWRNRAFLLWAGAALITLALGVGTALLQRRFHLSPLSPSLWGTVLASAIVLPFGIEILKHLMPEEYDAERHLGSHGGA